MQVNYQVNQGIYATLAGINAVSSDGEEWFEHDEFNRHLEALIDVLLAGILHRFGTS